MVRNSRLNERAAPRTPLPMIRTAAESATSVLGLEDEVAQPFFGAASRRPPGIGRLRAGSEGRHREEKEGPVKTAGDFGDDLPVWGRAAAWEGSRALPVRLTR